MKKYIKLMRVHHYIKNFLVFAALVCSGQLFNGEKLLAGALGFGAFCLISSVIYVVNDIRDVEKDRLHPTKCKRPIASGAVSVKQGWLLAVGLFVLSMGLNALEFHPVSTALLLLYFVLNLAYSFGLKNVPMVDVTILVSGFLIRILYGAFITGITISNWLYLTVIALAFYFSLGKRRNELKHLKDGQTRKVLQYYPIAFLDKSMYMCLTLAIAFYSLWSMDERTIALYNNEYLVFTVPIVMLIVMKYSLAVEGESDGDPVEVLVHDKVLLGLVGVYLLAMFCILYL